MKREKRLKRSLLSKAQNRVWGLGAETQWVGEIRLSENWRELGFIPGDETRMLDDKNGLTCQYRCPAGTFRKHVHNDSDEIVTVQQGTCLVETIDGIQRLEQGDTLTIPRGWFHIFKFESPENKLLLYYPKYDDLWKAGE